MLPVMLFFGSAAHAEEPDDPAAMLEAALAADPTAPLAAESAAQIPAAEPSLVTFIPAVFGLICLTLAAVILWRGRKSRRYLKNKIDNLRYTDSTTGYKNTLWFRKFALSELNRKYPGALDNNQVCLFMLTARNASYFHEFYGTDVIKAAIKTQLKLAEKLLDGAVCLAVSSDHVFYYALSVLPPGADVSAAASKVLRQISSYTVDNHTLSFSYAVGVRILPKGKVNDINPFLNDAYLAQETALEKNLELCVYDSEMTHKVIFSKKLEDDREDALKQNQFKMFLQPKYNLKTHALMGAEALVRWKHPQFGTIYPDSFIPAFERDLFVLKLDYHMLEEACRLQRGRLDRRLPIVPIAVNQSALHIEEKDYLSKISGILNRYKLPQGAIELEITETAFVNLETKEVNKSACSVIDGLHRLSLKLSLDDFCTGYSSISLLQNIKAEIMKIDRSMLLSAEKSPRAELILDHVISLGHALSMQVLCEGVETPAQEALLLRHGCTVAQGYNYAKPMSMEDFERFIKTHAIDEGIAARLKR